MEHNFYNDDFERLLKEKSDEFRMYPSKRVWHSIYNNLHPGRKWPSIAISLFLISALFFVGYWNNTSKQENIAVQSQAKGNDNLLVNTVSQNNTIAVLPIKNNALVSNASLLPVDINNTLSTKKQPNNISTKTPSNISRSGALNNTTIKNNGKKNSDKSVTNNSVAFTTVDVNKEFISKEEVPAIVNNQIVNENNIVKSDATSITEPAKLIAVENSIPTSTTTEINNSTSTLPSNNTDNNNVSLIIKNNDIDITSKTSDKVAFKSNAKNSTPISMQDKSWIDDYAFYNKTVRNKWKSRIASEIYITPGVGYRSFISNNKYGLIANASSLSPLANNINPKAITLNHRPGLSFEIGAGLIVSVSKNIRVKAGVQANFTNYSIEVAPVNHPISTTIMLNDVNSGFPYLEARTSSVANSSLLPGFITTQVHNQTQQLSIPIGVAVKLAGNNNLEWYAGTSIQPTYVLSGKANLISADHKNYINEASMIRNWNVNTGLETYFHYKMNNYTLQFGPQFRYQLASTYTRQYTYTEKLYNLGMKVGLVKKF